MNISGVMSRTEFEELAEESLSNGKYQLRNPCPMVNISRRILVQWEILAEESLSNGKYKQKNPCPMVNISWDPYPMVNISRGILVQW